MVDKQLLLARLDDIGRSLERAGNALALIGLGSVGIELDRLDEFSDLDFFVIVQPGYKLRFIEQLDWLEAVCPIVYAFRNTDDGHKVLFRDGVFAEFAVFEPHELGAIPFARGRMVWKRPHVNESLATPAAGTPPPARPIDWLVGEALTNLFVGLQRYRRGERLSAQRFVQGYAVDRVIELAERLEPPAPGTQDAFAHERRFEQRFPRTAAALPDFVQGYARTPESAAAILGHLEQRAEVNPAMAAAIRELIGEPRPAAHLRVARPTDDLDGVVRFYHDGLGFELLGAFEDHAGFDGVMLGHPGLGYHLEFTRHGDHAAGRAPTQDNLLVLYLPEEAEWRAAVQRMADHGYAPVPSFNPYWDARGRTFEDPDGYRVVLQNAAWS